MTVQHDLYAADGAPGLAISQFFTDLTPTQDRFNALSAVTAQQETAYTAMGVGDPDLAGYEALGKGFAAAHPERVNIGTASDAYFTGAYSNVFGRAATPDQIAHFVAQETYFKGIYAAAGFTASDAAIQARGSAVGQLIGFAVQDASTPFAKGVANFYADAADGSVTYGRPLFFYAPPTAPGPTVYVPTEPTHQIVRIVDGVLDKTSEKIGTPGEIYIGNGGNMNTGYQFTEDKTASVEVGFKVHDRGGADRLSTSVDADGKVHIDALAGAQIGVPNRGATALDFSVNLGLGETTDTKFLIKMGLDTDGTIATNFNVSTFDNAGGFWTNSFGVPVIGNDGARNGTGHLIQDSTNAAFAAWLGVADAPEGIYDAYLSVLNTVTGVEVKQTIQMHLYDVI